LFNRAHIAPGAWQRERIAPETLESRPSGESPEREGRSATREASLRGRQATGDRTTSVSSDRMGRAVSPKLVQSRRPSPLWVAKATSMPIEEPGPRASTPPGSSERGTYEGVTQEPLESRCSGESRNDLSESKRAGRASSSRSAALGAVTWGNRAAGPCRAKSSAEEAEPQEER